jgi:hypothetical protein
MKIKLLGVSLVIILLLSSYPTISAKYTISNIINLTEINEENEYDLLIITSDRFIIPLSVLKHHKDSYGVITKIVTIKEILSSKYFSVHGRDLQEKIKHFIKDSIESWGVSNVMLFGDLQIIPMRDGCLWDIFVPTDLYYADIYDSEGNFSSWDSNNNDKFGEYLYNETGDPSGKLTDEVDLVPDVGVGRIACSNLFDACVVIDKIIKYESQQYNESWFKKFILCGGDPFHRDRYFKFFDILFGGGPEGEESCDMVSENLSNFESIKFYDSMGTLYPDKINEELNEGAGFVLFSGHGIPRKWSGSGNFDNKSYTVNHVNKLSNGYKLPIVFFDACSTGILDFSPGGIMHLPSITYRFLAKFGGGSIASIGSSVPAYTGVLEGGGNMLALNFFKAFNEIENCSLSDMFMKAQEDYIQNYGDRHTLYGYNLQGDPSLRVGGYNYKLNQENEELNFVENYIKNKVSSNFVLPEISEINVPNRIYLKNIFSTINIQKLADAEEKLCIFDTGLNECANSIITDSSDSIIIAGFIDDNVSQDLFVVKYDKDGNELFNITYDSGKIDVAFDLAVDKDDNIYVVGYTGSFKQDMLIYSSILLFKYDPSGNEIWNITYKEGFCCTGNSIAIDSEGNLLVVGYCANLRDPWLGSLTVKFNGSTGEKIWSRYYHKFCGDESYAVAVDSEDNVILVGCSWAIEPTNELIIYQEMGYLAIKYDKNGNVIWEKRFLKKEQACTFNVAVDSQDNIIITGYNTIIGLYSFTHTLKVDKDGNILWEKKYTTGIKSRTYPFSLVIDSDDNIFVAGITYLSNKDCPFALSYDKDGKFLWTKNLGINGTIYGLTINSSGVLLATGTEINSNDDSYVLEIKEPSNKLMLKNRLINFFLNLF